jgi:hypothetical protein
MKKFLFALLLGVLMVGTLVAEESYNIDKDVPDIVYSIDMTDVQSLPVEFNTLNIESINTPVEVGWLDTTNIIYKKEYPATNLYRCNTNSNSYALANVSFAKKVKLPDIDNRLL